MSDTMNTMEIKKVDILRVDTLEIGDLIGYEGEIVIIQSILDVEEHEQYFFDIVDEWGESGELVIPYDTMVDLYYPVEVEEE